jgi:hypothetical protein
MEIQLISHASVVIATDVKILTDPWFFGKAFNDSWSLYPEPPELDDSFFDSIDYLYISHEHPDHFHIPTLRSLPGSFKNRVIVLFQENNSEKVFNALKRLGYPNSKALPHDKIVALTEKTKVYCYESGSMDSALGVISDDQVVLNINDCEINKRDCRRILRSLGKVDVALNQFSIAGYSGFKERDKYLPAQAKKVLQKMLNNHIDLKAGATVPFASFIYFSSEDNRYINEYSNTPRDAFDHFREHSQKLVPLFLGDRYEVGSDHDPQSSLQRFEEQYADPVSLVFDNVGSVSVEEIQGSFDKLVDQIHKRYPGTLLRLFKPVIVKIPDLDTKIVFSIRTGEFRVDNDADPDLEIRSEPLHFGFSFPYGIQTLGVSARYTLLKGFRNWQLHRILFSLNNAEVYLRPKLFFTHKNVSFFWTRLPGAINQIAYRLKVMR